MTLGETLVCLTGQETGRLETVRTFRKSIGGAESNTAIGVTRLGLRAGWISRVSRDGFGDEILKLLRGEGVTVTDVVRASAPTGLMVKERRSATDVHVHYYRQGSAATGLAPDDVTAASIETARRFHVTGVTLALGDAPRAAVHRALQIASSAGVPVSFDPNLRFKLWTVDEAMAAYGSVLPFVTDLLCNEQEALVLAGSDTLEVATERLLGLGFESLVIKRGELGAIGFRNGDVVEETARPVHPIDTVGAGDAFNAGYLFGRLEDLSFKRSIEIGNWAASHVVAHLGDYEGFPSLDDYRAWIDQDVEVTR